MSTGPWSPFVVFAPDEPPDGSPPPPPADEFVPPPGMLPDPPPPIDAGPGDVVVLVGTTKGLFVLSAGPDRTHWQRTGPWFPGEEVSSAVLDCRGGRTRLLVGATSSHWGPSVYAS